MINSLIVDSTFSYQWQFNNVDVPGANDTLFYASAGGDYTLIVSTPNCGSATSTSVTINALVGPTANVTAIGNTTICQGDSVQLYTNYSPGFIFEWQVDGNIIPGANDSVIYANQSGNYYVITSNYCDVVLSNIIPVTVNVNPVSAFSSSGSTICFGDSSYFASLNLDPSYTYQWQLNNVDIPGATNSDYYASTQGYYTLVVTTPTCGSQTSPIYLLNVIAQVVATFNISSAAICTGDSALLSAPYNTGYAYQWQFNGTDIPGATDSLLYVSAPGDYSLVAATALCGTDTAPSVTLTILQPPVASISASGAIDFCEGDSVVLSALTDPGYTYQWQLNGIDITGANSDTYNVLASGIYTAIVSNTCGIIPSNDITVTVTSLPDASFTNAATTGCIGDSILLSAINTPGYTYQWQLDGVDIAGANTSDYYALVGGNYSLIVTTPLCGSDSSTAVTLIIDSVPVADVAIVGNTFFCNGDSVTFNATPGTGYTYQWQYNGADITGATSPDLVAFASGVYNLLVSNACSTVSSPFISVSVIPTPDTTVTLSGPTSFCAGDSVILTVVSDPSFTYQWFINGNGNPADTLNTLTATQAGTYFCEINSQLGCGKENSSLITVIVGSVPPFTLQNAAAVCQGDTVILDATILPATLNFQWWMDGNPIPGATSQTLIVTDSGSYQIQYWSPCDTVLSNSVNVIINQLPAIPVISQVADTLTCTTAGATYQWYFNGAIIPGATQQTYTVSIDGDYSVIITDANGCTNTSATFTFNSSGITINDNGLTFSIAPNPTVNDVQIAFGNTIKEKITVNIIATSGAITKMIETDNSKGTKNLRINLSSFATGIYMMEITIGEKVYHEKIVKQ